VAVCWCICVATGTVLGGVNNSPNSLSLCSVWNL
jgi:hypothetical protein